MFAWSIFDNAFYKDETINGEVYSITKEVSCNGSVYFEIMIRYRTADAAIPSKDWLMNYSNWCDMTVEEQKNYPGAYKHVYSVDEFGDEDYDLVFPEPFGDEIKYINPYITYKTIYVCDYMPSFNRIKNYNFNTVKKGDNNKKYTRICVDFGDVFNPHPGIPEIKIDGLPEIDDMVNGKELEFDEPF